MAAPVRRHDERFLAEIKVERWLGLHEGRLREQGPADDRGLL